MAAHRTPPPPARVVLVPAAAVLSVGSTIFLSQCRSSPRLLLSRGPPEASGVVSLSVLRAKGPLLPCSTTLRPKRPNRYCFVQARNHLAHFCASAPQVADEALAAGSPRVECFQYDAASVASIRSAFASLSKVFPYVDVVVVNSGIALPSPFETTTEEDYDAMFNVNTKGAFFTAQEGARLLRDSGRLVFVSSIVTHSVNAGTSAYTGTKGAMTQFARILAVELAPRKITVNVVSPGATDTAALFPQVREIAPQMTPLKRLGTPEDVANVVAFLVSEEGGWLTGTDIPTCGGAVIY